MCAKTSNKSVKVKTSISLDPAVITWLRKQADKLDRSMSWVINDLLSEKADKDADKSDG